MAKKKTNVNVIDGTSSMDIVQARATETQTDGFVINTKGFNDYVRSSVLGDVISTGGGNDTITLSTADEVVSAGSGTDVINIDASKIFRTKTISLSRNENLTINVTGISDTSSNHYYTKVEGNDLVILIYADSWKTDIQELGKIVLTNYAKDIIYTNDAINDTVNSLRIVGTTTETPAQTVTFDLVNETVNGVATPTVQYSKSANLYDHLKKGTLTGSNLSELFDLTGANVKTVKALGGNDKVLVSEDKAYNFTLGEGENTVQYSVTNATTKDTYTLTEGENLNITGLTFDNYKIKGNDVLVNTEEGKTLVFKNYAKKDVTGEYGSINIGGTYLDTLIGLSNVKTIQTTKYTGSRFADRITVASTLSGKKVTADLKEGNNSYSRTTTKGDNVVTAGSGDDTITINGLGCNTIKAGNGSNVINYTNTSLDTSIVTLSKNNFVTGSDNDTINITSYNTYEKITAGAGENIVKFNMRKIGISGPHYVVGEDEYTLTKGEQLTIQATDLTLAELHDIEYCVTSYAINGKDLCITFGDNVGKITIKGFANKNIVGENGYVRFAGSDYDPEDSSTYYDLGKETLATYTITNSDKTQTIKGTWLGEVFDGSAATNTLNINGAGGNDIITGGKGDDIITGGTGANTVKYVLDNSTAFGYDVINLTSGEDFTLQFTGTNAETLFKQNVTVSDMDKLGNQVVTVYDGQVNSQYIELFQFIYTREYDSATQSFKFKQTIYKYDADHLTGELKSEEYVYSMGTSKVHAYYMRDGVRTSSILEEYNGNNQTLLLDSDYFTDYHYVGGSIRTNKLGAITLKNIGKTSLENATIMCNDSLEYNFISSTPSSSAYTINKKTLTATSYTDSLTVNNKDTYTKIDMLSGNDTVTIAEGTKKNLSVNLGNGDNTYSGANLSGNATIIAGNGDNTITTSNGDDKITVGISNFEDLGSYGNIITAGKGLNIITTGAGDNTLTDIGLASDKLDFSKYYSSEQLENFNTVLSFTKEKLGLNYVNADFEGKNHFVFAGKIADYTFERAASSKTVKFNGLTANSNDLIIYENITVDDSEEPGTKTTASIPVLIIKNYFNSTDSAENTLFKFADDGTGYSNLEGLGVNIVIEGANYTKSKNSIVGTEYNDFITGSSAKDTIYAKTGDDIIDLSQGTKTLIFQNGDGNDKINIVPGSYVENVQFNFYQAYNEAKPKNSVGYDSLDDLYFDCDTTSGATKDLVIKYNYDSSTSEYKDSVTVRGYLDKDNLLYENIYQIADAVYIGNETYSISKDAVLHNGYTQYDSLDEHYQYGTFMSDYEGLEFIAEDGVNHVFTYDGKENGDIYVADFDGYDTITGAKCCIVSDTGNEGTDTIEIKGITKDKLDLKTTLKFTYDSATQKVTFVDGTEDSIEILYKKDADNYQSLTVENQIGTTQSIENIALKNGDAGYYTLNSAVIREVVANWMVQNNAGFDSGTNTYSTDNLGEKAATLTAYLQTSDLVWQQ